MNAGRGLRTCHLGLWRIAGDACGAAGRRVELRRRRRQRGAGRRAAPLARGLPCGGAAAAAAVGEGRGEGAVRGLAVERGDTHEPLLRRREHGREAVPEVSVGPHGDLGDRLPAPRALPIHTRTRDSVPQSAHLTAAVSSHPLRTIQTGCENWRNPHFAACCASPAQPALA